MTIEQLKTYLRKIIELETTVYAQMDAIEALENRINRLAIRGYHLQPSKPNGYEAEMVGCLPAFLGLFPAALIGVILHLFGLEIIATALLVLIPVAFFMHANKIEEEKARELSRKEIEQYESDMCTYRRNMEVEEARVKAEQCQKDKLSAMLYDLRQQCIETRNILRYYYSQNILFSKYQNFVAVCSLYEYLESDRCTSLGGYEGAYNIFETELRLDRICAKLDVVLEHLSDIKDNQIVLYDAIQDGNRATQNLYNETIRQSQLLGEVGENIALTAEYARISAANAEAGAWIGLANYLK